MNKIEEKIKRVNQNINLKTIAVKTGPVKYIKISVINKTDKKILKKVILVFLRETERFFKIIKFNCIKTKFYYHLILQLSF